jgi:hypothetical protein
MLYAYATLKYSNEMKSKLDFIERAIGICDVLHLHYRKEIDFYKENRCNVPI